MKKSNSETLADVLNTKSKDEQLKAVKSLISMVQMPVIDIVVRYDGRTNNIATSIVGIDSIPGSDVVQILEAATKSIRDQELNMLKEKVKEDEPNPEPAKE